MGKFTGKPHISWEKPWFPVDFPQQTNAWMFYLENQDWDFPCKPSSQLGVFHDLGNPKNGYESKSWVNGKWETMGRPPITSYNYSWENPRTKWGFSSKSGLITKGTLIIKPVAFASHILKTWKAGHWLGSGDSREPRGTRGWTHFREWIVFNLHPIHPNTLSLWTRLWLRHLHLRWSR